MAGKKITLIISGLACALCFIFYMGTRESVVSNATSDLITGPLYRMLVELGCDPNWRNLNIYIRKGAHIVEYGALGVFFSWIILFFLKQCWAMYIWLPIILCHLCARLDEYLQSFHHRTSCMRDVWIDTIGAVIFVLLFALVRGIRQWTRHRRTQTTSDCHG